MNPLISIVTVCFNAVNNIEETILSVISQSYENIEYIIIDGGSTDGTVDIIKKYESKIHYWISEPDQGVYDAMNKGINRATGKWINFMNAGDTFYYQNTLELCANLLNKERNIDVLYGNTILIYNNASYLAYPYRLNNLNNHMIFCHQSSLIKRELLENNLFNLEYKIAADYNQIKTLYKQGYKFHHINKPIAYYEAENGISSTRIKEQEIEYAKINHGNKSKKYYYSYIIIIIRHFIKKLTPKFFILKRKEKLLRKNPLLQKIQPLQNDK